MVDKYKDIAEYLDLMTDKALALLGSLGAMIACGCKLQFGYMNDLYGFKKVYSLVIVLILGSGVGINFGTSNPFVYGFYVCMSYSNLGAHYTILAPVCRRLYGNTTGMKVWGILYSSIGFGSLIAFCVQITQTNLDNAIYVFTFLSGLSILVFSFLYFMREKELYSNDKEIPLLEKKLHESD